MGIKKNKKMSLLHKVKCPICGKEEEIFSVYEPIPTAPCLDCQRKEREEKK